jgi:hypothetical protein
MGGEGVVGDAAAGAGAGCCACPIPSMRKMARIAPEITMLTSFFTISVYLLEGFGLRMKDGFIVFLPPKDKACVQRATFIIHSSQYPHFLRPPHKLRFDGLRRSGFSPSY